ncbi:MAG: SMP-30/gluconolactonase/LRE family protein [Actinomycetota bacterium]
MIDLSAFETAATGLDHPEGIAVGPDGELYAGGEAGQIYRIGADGTVKQIASTDGFIYGIALDGDGNVYACDYGNASVARISVSGSVETYSTGTPDLAMRVPNFPAFDDAGNLYVTDSGEWGDDDGVVFRIAPAGGTEIWTRAVPRFPNGCALDADGRHLYVIESHGRAISRLRIGDDDRAGEPETVVELPGSQPDGLAFAEDGALYVGCYRPDRIYRVSPDGAAEVVAEDPDGVTLNQPTNVAFSGPGRGRLAVSGLGGWSIVATVVGVAGLPLRYPKL